MKLESSIEDLYVHLGNHVLQVQVDNIKYNTCMFSCMEKIEICISSDNV